METSSSSSSSSSSVASLSDGTGLVGTFGRLPPRLRRLPSDAVAAAEAALMVVDLVALVAAAAFIAASEPGTG